jgi:hypothetical protein
LDGPITTIGRAADNDIVLIGQRVSKHHAEVQQDGEQYMLRDLASTNGTFVNGQRLRTPQPLKRRDLLDIGDLTLMFIEGTMVGPPRLHINKTSARVFVGQREIKRSPLDYQILLALFRKPGALVTREDLEKAWPKDGKPLNRDAVDQAVARLRHTLEPERAERGEGSYIETVRGLGYRLRLA